MLDVGCWMLDVRCWMLDVRPYWGLIGGCVGGVLGISWGVVDGFLVFWGCWMLT